MADNLTMAVDLLFQADTSKLKLGEVENVLSDIQGVLKATETELNNLMDRANKDTPIPMLEKLMDALGNVRIQLDRIRDYSGTDFFNQALQETKQNIKEVGQAWQQEKNRMYAKNDPQLAAAWKADKAGEATPEQLALLDNWHKKLQEISADEKELNNELKRVQANQAAYDAQTQADYLVRQKEQLGSYVSELKNTMSVIQEFKQSQAETTGSERMDKEIQSLLNKLQKLQTDAELATQKMTEYNTLSTDNKWSTMAASADVFFQKVLQVADGESRAAQNAERMRDAIVEMAQTGLQNNEAVRQAEEEARALQRAEEYERRHAQATDEAASSQSTFADRLRETTSELHGKFSQGLASAQKGLKKFAKKFMMFGLGFRSTYFMIKRLRKVFIESFKEMAKSIPEINTQVSGFMTAMNQVKGSIGTAFQPIVSKVMPILMNFMDMLNRAAVAVGKFFATLTGQGYIYEYTANQVDYAADETEKASKKMKKSLAGFDEINQLGGDSDSSSGKNKSGGGTYKKVAVDEDEFDLAKKLREAINSGDWEGAGKILADKVNDFFNLDWKKMASDFGKKVYEVVHGALRFAIGFIQGVDWGQAANAVWDALSGFFGSINWGQLVIDIFELLGSALGGIGAFILTIGNRIAESFKNGFHQVVEKYFVPYMTEDGKLTIEGFFQGMWDMIKGIGIWIWDHIFMPFIEGFCKAFGIASPSKVMIEYGKMVIQGLFNGILQVWEKVKAWWAQKKEALSTNLTNFKNNVVAKATDLKTKLSNAINSIKTAWTNAWTAMKTGVTNIWNGIKNMIKNTINGIIGFINGMIQGIVNGINRVFSVLNKIHIDIPDNIPKYGGMRLGFNLQPIQVKGIPYLAKGGVVPPNKEFLAMLGDNTKETEVVSPLSTMKQALTEALRESNYGGGKIDSLTVYLSVADVTKAVVTQINGTTKQTGTCPIKLVKA